MQRTLNKEILEDAKWKSGLTILPVICDLKISHREPDSLCNKDFQLARPVFTMPIL